MTTNKLTADQLSDLVERAKTAQENLSEAWLELSRIHDEFFEGDSHIRAYVLDHLRILISEDHGFLSRDSNVGNFIEELEKAFEEASEPRGCDVCEVLNLTETPWPLDLCPQCAANPLCVVVLDPERTVTLYREAQEEEYFFGWKLWFKRGGVQWCQHVEEAKWAGGAEALQAGVALSLTPILSSPVDPTVYEIRRV